MIKADELREFRPVVRYRDGNQITLQTVQEAIKDCAQGMGIPVAFYTDQVKSGGMFNKTIEDCIVLYHPEHQYDYFKICVRVIGRSKSKLEEEQNYYACIIDIFDEIVS